MHKPLRIHCNSVHSKHHKALVTRSLFKVFPKKSVNGAVVKAVATCQRPVSSPILHPAHLCTWLMTVHVEVITSDTRKQMQTNRPDLHSIIFIKG